MDSAKVDLLLTYILAIAGQEEAGNRQLGAIHLIKYVYLADLAFAETHGGKPFTGVVWRFHHFGPWSAEVYERIEPVVRKAGAEERRISSKFEDDFVRWSLQDERLAETLDGTLSREVSRAVKQAIRRFGQDTSALLHFVYATRPMLSAKPGEVLEFTLPRTIDSEETRGETDASTAPAANTSVGVVGLSGPAQPRSKADERRRRQKLKALREGVRAKLNASPRSRLVAPTPLPRYDAVYSEGIAWLDQQAGESIEPSRGELMFSERIWKSRSRGDHNLS
jgi:hypothetical protein